MEEMSKADIDKLVIDDKRRLANKLSLMGIAHSDLAVFFKVSTRTIYNWIKSERDSFVEELEAKTAIDLVVEQLADLAAYEKLFMREASALGQEQIEVDIETGQRRIKNPARSELGNKAKFLALAIDAKAKQIALLTQVGAIPKAVEKMYQKIGDNRTDALEPTDLSKIDEEKLSESVLEKINQQVRMSQ